MAHHDFHMPVSEAQVRSLKVGDTVTLNGTLFGIRDATQIHMFDRGRTTRFDLRGHAVLHTAPNVRQVPKSNEHPTGYASVCVGTRPLMQEYGVRIVIGKGGLGEGSLQAFQDLGGVYLAVIGGAAALETTWIEAIEEVDFEDLIPECLWRFAVKGFGPLLVTMDSHSGSAYAQVAKTAESRRAASLAAMGVKA